MAHADMVDLFNLWKNQDDFLSLMLRRRLGEVEQQWVEDNGTLAEHQHALADVYDELRVGQASSAVTCPLVWTW